MGSYWSVCSPALKVMTPLGGGVCLAEVGRWEGLLKALLLPVLAHPLSHALLSCPALLPRCHDGL